MENSESDWEEIGPEALGEEKPGSETKETEANRQSLTPKVLDLMEKMSEYGYLTIHEVQLIFANKTWAYKVVNGLRNLGFIADHDTLMSPRTAHYLTPKGYRILDKFGRLKVGIRFKPERYSIFIFQHRMACAKVSLLLEKHPLVHAFLPESRLFRLRKNKQDKLCDGEFCYAVPGHEKADRVGLEVELTFKSNPRLDETFHELARRKDLDQVWWICANAEIRRGMRREVQRRYIPDSQRHFFCLLPEFLAAKSYAELMDSKGALFSINPNQPTLLPRPPEPPRPMILPPPQIQESKNPAMAQAEAPKQPEPAPSPELVASREDNPSIAWELLSWFALITLRLLKWIWRWLKDSWSLSRCYDDSWELEFHRWPHVCTAAALVLGFAVYRNSPALLRTLDLMPPQPPPRWHSRKPEAIFWDLGEFDFSVPFLESKGNQYRMQVRLQRTEPEYRGGCSVNSIEVADTKGRPLARWKVTDLSAGVYGRSTWNSEMLSFRAPAQARKLIVTLALAGSRLYGTCHDWSVPVGFR